jgi:two-component system NtrC family sensor kinase
MLQHSSGSSGEHQSTNINQLVEEYLQLAYHGYRARDMAFTVVVNTSYNPSTG